MKKLILVLIILLTACSLKQTTTVDTHEKQKESVNFRDGKYLNNSVTDSPSIAKVFRIIYKMATKDKTLSVPTEALPVKTLTNNILKELNDENLHIVRLGHSSLMLKIHGEFWLIDPVFSQRASPVSFAGPQRFHPAPISMDDLPTISKILISHNHFDHLDKTAVRHFADTNTEFLVPHGVDSILMKWGIRKENISAFGWWDEIDSGKVLTALTPSQHFSGRGLFDRDKTLWGSWVIKTKSESLFFSGDTGYFDGFKSIGERYGPFDMTFIETGAYDAEWPEMHLFPEQSVQAHLDLQGETMLPIHNGTFDLAFHPWKEPFERVHAEAKRLGVKLITPIAGQVISVGQLPTTDSWWNNFSYPN